MAMDFRLARRGVISTRWASARRYASLTAVLACLLLVGCGNPTAARDQGQTISPTVKPTSSPPHAAVDITPRQVDAIFGKYRFRDGDTLPQLRLHYAVLGQPHRDQQGGVDNAILVLHWTNASSQALLVPEYREALFGPGAPFDVTRFLVIIPDDIGHGQSSKPSDGLRAGFPHYGYGDMVDLQHKLVAETLGVSHLRAIVGISMGCMNAWQWAETYPDAMDAIMPIACFPAPISGRNLLWRRMSIDDIKSDPAWADGNYQHQPPSAAIAQEIARMMIDGVPNLQEEVPTSDKADAFLRSIKQQGAGLDANDLLYSLESSRDFNAEPDLGKITTKVFALNFADDEFYRDSLQVLQRDTPKLKQAQIMVRGLSAGSAGHFTMAHPQLWKDQAADFMSWSNPR